MAQTGYKASKWLTFQAMTNTLHKTGSSKTSANWLADALNKLGRIEAHAAEPEPDDDRYPSAGTFARTKEFLKAVETHTASQLVPQILASPNGDLSISWSKDGK